MPASQDARERHQNRLVGHGLTRNASRKTYVLAPTRTTRIKARIADLDLRRAA